MKKLVFVLLFVVFASWSVWAQGFYFDVGAGVGLSRMVAIDSGLQNNDGGLDLTLRVGYGLGMDRIPVYLAVEFGLTGGSFYAYDKFLDYEITSSLAAQLFSGPGIILYPVPQLQLGASLGWCGFNYSYEFMNDSNKTIERDYFSNGFAWNISAAFDFNYLYRNLGVLFGIKYYGSVNKIDLGDDILLSSYFGIFVKFAYRKKAPQQTVAVNAAAEKPQPAPRTPPPPRPQPGLDGAITRASGELIKDLPENTRLAVINISSGDANVSARVVDELEFQLVSSRKFTIVDRNTLEAIRSEQNFQMSGEVSDSSAVSIGEMLGANIVITGSITAAGKTQRLSLRALDVRTAEIVTMVREEF